MRPSLLIFGLLTFGVCSSSVHADPVRSLSSTWSPRIDPELNESGQFVSADSEFKTPAVLRSINFQVSPIGELAGHYNLSLEVGVLNSLSLGAKATYITTAGTGMIANMSGSETGIRATLYPTGRRFENGMILRGGLYYGNWEVGSFLEWMNEASWSGYRYRSVVNGPVAESLVGYQWVFKSGFNLDLAAGATAYNASFRSVSLSTGARTEYQPDKLVVMPVIEFNMGLAF